LCLEGGKGCVLNVLSRGGIFDGGGDRMYFCFHRRRNVTQYAIGPL